MVLRFGEINVNHCLNVTYDFDRADSAEKVV